MQVGRRDTTPTRSNDKDWGKSLMSDWDWVLLAVGAYIAVMSLIRMMKARQLELIVELQKEFEKKL